MFRIDARYFAKNTVIQLLSYLLSVCRGLVTGYLVARLLTPRTYGGYSLVIDIVGIVSLLTLPGMESAMARDISQRGREHAALRFSIFWNTILSLSGIFVLLSIIPFLHFWNQQSLWPLFFAAAFLFIPNNIGQTFFSAIITGTGAFTKSLKVATLSSLLVVIGVLIALWFTHSAVIIYVLVVGIPSFLSLWMLRREIHTFPSREKTWRVIRYASFLSINSIPFAIAWYFDGFLVTAFFGLKNLALFQVAILIPEQVKALYKSIMPISYSRQARANDSLELRKKLRRIVFLGTCIMLVGIALYCAAAQWIMQILFPNYDTASLTLLTRLMALSVATLPSMLFSQFFEAQGFIREQRWIQWLTTGLYIILLVLLIPRFGPLGAVICRLTYRIFGSLLSLLFIYIAPIRKSQISDPD